MVMVALRGPHVMVMAELGLAQAGLLADQPHAVLAALAVHHGRAMDGLVGSLLEGLEQQRMQPEMCNCKNLG